MKSPCPVHWAEILVHEIGHHYLTILLGTTVIDAETKNKFKESRHSHQKQTLRPLIGILHGVFAQSCILIFASKILLDQMLSEKWKEGAQKTFDRYATIFPHDLKTVETSCLIFHPLIFDLIGLAKLYVDKVYAEKGERS